MTVPYGETAVQFARSSGQGLVVHNYGAIQALERLLPLVRETGFILINDYGQVAPETAGDFQHQRYSQSTFIGINFPFLKACFSDQALSVWVDPTDESQASIHARLLARRPAAETVTCFHDRFGKDAQDERQEPVQRARDGLKAGQFEAALAAYELALERQPYNWALMNEVAYFLTFSLHNPRAGLELARAALACNPACSPDLWNVLGDSLFELGRIEEARQAYLHALRINPDDARAHFNLTFVHVRTRESAAALHRIAEALILDRAGTYRERLLQTQSEVLAQLSRRRQQEALRKANRINTRQDSSKPGRTREDTPNDVLAPTEAR
jgi:tetratricopeptide (TPR) repeat protein